MDEVNAGKKIDIILTDAQSKLLQELASKSSYTIDNLCKFAILSFIERYRFILPCPVHSDIEIVSIDDLDSVISYIYEEQ